MGKKIRYINGSSRKHSTRLTGVIRSPGKNGEEKNLFKKKEIFINLKE